MSNILLLQIYDDNQKSLSDITTISAKTYAKKHDIDYMRINISDIVISEKSDLKMFKDLHPAYAKIWILFLLDFDTNYDFVWILDIDTFFVNYEISIKDIIDEHLCDYDEDGVDAICSVNGVNGGKLLNTGSIIYRLYNIGTLFYLFENYRQSRNQTIMNQPFWEQDFLNDVHQFHNLDFKIKPLEMNVLNSYWGNYEQNQLLFHFMARSYEEKIKIATKHIIEKQNPLGF